MSDGNDVLAKLGLRQTDGRIAANIEIVHQENRVLENPIIFTEKRYFTLSGQQYDVEKPVKVNDMVAVWQRRGYTIVHEDNEVVIMAKGS